VSTIRTQPLCIDIDHPSLPGHFPGQPVVPGVVILDHVLAAALSPGWQLARLPQVKFLQPLLPAQSAVIALETVAADAQAQRLRFRVSRAEENGDDHLLASGELILTATSRDD